MHPAWLQRLKRGSQPFRTLPLWPKCSPIRFHRSLRLPNSCRRSGGGAAQRSIGPELSKNHGASRNRRCNNLCCCRALVFQHTCSSGRSNPPPMGSTLVNQTPSPFLPAVMHPHHETHLLALLPVLNQLHQLALLRLAPLAARGRGRAALAAARRRSRSLLLLSLLARRLALCTAGRAERAGSGGASTTARVGS